MPQDFLRWMGDIHQVVSPPWAVLICTLLAVLCGGLIGFDRERARKPAGFRTLLLICLGASIYTQASLLITSGGGDRSRIASQVVVGIGFLGAGAIIRDRGNVAGLTTSASIWATAAVGLVIGSGYVAMGVCFTLVIFGILSVSAVIERAIRGPCEIKNIILEYDPAGGKTRFLVRAVLDNHQSKSIFNLEEQEDEIHRATVEYCTRHADHRSFLKDLMEVPGLKNVTKSEDRPPTGR